MKRHSFYPFIAYEIKSKKVRKGDDGKTLAIKEKKRPVSYASHVDSHIYTYYTYLLNGAYEKLITDIGIEQNVLAFRKLGKSNIDFANDAFDQIIERRFCAAIAFDIEGFFDNLDHSILKKSWCRAINLEKMPDDHYNVFKSLTKFSKVYKEPLYEAFRISKNNPKNKNKRVCDPADFREVVRKNGMININNTKKGIPQGSPISALLSNIYMIEFDEVVSSLMGEINGCYLRYCDDILCIVPLSRKNEIIDRVNKEIEKLKLNINRDKTKTSEYRIVKGQLACDYPLQYLGFVFDGHHKLIRSAALARFSERMKSGVRLAKLTRMKYNRIRIEKGQPRQDVYKRKIYERYSHLGQRNFIRYGLRCAATMGSNAIKKQLKPFWARLQSEIEK
ncbi:MAG: antiviral reverse transcriptase Drt2 [Desulfurivibrionaceae bacterium]